MQTSSLSDNHAELGLSLLSRSSFCNSDAKTRDGTTMTDKHGHEHTRNYEASNLTAPMLMLAGVRWKN